MKHENQPKPGGDYQENPRNREIESHFPHKGGDGMRRGTNPGYDPSAHTSTHHGPEGRAEGSVGDHALPMHTKTQAEGREHGPGPGYAEKHHSDGSGKAHHHPAPVGEAHSFSKPAAMAHGFGHSEAHRSGPMRLSGHSGAHRIGHKRGK